MNRKEQNRVAKTWAEIKRAVDALDPLVVPVLLRGTFESGVRKDPQGRSTKSDGSKFPKKAFEVSAQATPYSDDTGETAIKVEVADRVSRAIETMAKNLGITLNFAKWIVDGVPETTTEAILREIPNCQACDRPVFGKVKAGYDLECYRRKQTLGISDRSEFRSARLAELVAEQESAETS